MPDFLDVSNNPADIKSLKNQLKYKSKTGRPAMSVDLKVVDEVGLSGHKSNNVICGILLNRKE